MPRATLIVHSFSFPYVENFVRCLLGILRRHLDAEAQLLIAEAVDAPDYEDGLVFVIGENFPKFRRRPGCRYVYLNLSVVTLLGSPFAASLSGYRHVFRKRRMLLAKLPLFDAVLDYYPHQTNVLRRQLSLPVFGFDVVVPVKTAPPVSKRDFDVCFVGGITPRRRRVLDKLRESGFVLSPASGAPIEEIAARSRCCLNVHMERSNHLEIPRVLAAVSAACPVVTESSFGLEDFGAGAFIEEVPYADLVQGVQTMLSDEDHLRQCAERAREWYVENYAPRAERRWEELFVQLKTLLRETEPAT